jgi:hypothetical protein
MAGDHALISLDGLSKVFYTEEVETHALSTINLAVKPGEFVSIAGPSGCGKTTLLSILGLLDSPTGGQYLLDNEPVENLSASQRAKIRNQAIGFVFQAFNLIGDLTVYENVELPLTYRGMPGSERKERVQAALALILDFSGSASRAVQSSSDGSDGDSSEGPGRGATVAILKHNTPCGVGTGASPLEAYQRAFDTDPESPFGGVIVCNRPFDLALAEELSGTINGVCGRIIPKPIKNGFFFF